MPFDTIEKASVLADLDAVRAKVAAIEPTDALQQALTESQALAADRLVVIGERDTRISVATTAVSQAQTALTAAAAALAPPAP